MHRRRTRSMPAWPQPAAGGPPPARPEALPRRVLLVEPRPLVRLGLRAYCQRIGVPEVIAAGDGPAALELLRGPPFDAVILALELPDRLRVALAAQKDRPTWVVGLGAWSGPPGGVDVTVDLHDSVEALRAALQFSVRHAPRDDQAAS